MWFLATKTGRTVAAVIAAVALLAGFIAYQRHDAAQDALDRVRLDAGQSRQEQVKEDRKNEDEIDRLDDTSLWDRASQWLR
jgi:hypothetical protein